MNPSVSRSAARAVFETHARGSSMFHVGRALLGLHAEIARTGMLSLGKGPTTPTEDLPEIVCSVELIDDPEAEGTDDVDRLLALAAVPPLPPVDGRKTVDAESLAVQLGRLFGIYVNEVHLISLSDPYADVGWLTDGALNAEEKGFAKTLDDCLDDDVEGTYWGRLDLSLGPKLLAGLKEDGIERIVSDVTMRFEGGIDAAVREAIGGLVSDRRVDEVRDNVMDTLIFFAGIAAIDDRSAGVPLGHVVRVLTSALPLGMKRGEPGTWLFLVA